MKMCMVRVKQYINPTKLAHPQTGKAATMELINIQKLVPNWLHAVLISHADKNATFNN